VFGRDPVRIAGQFIDAVNAHDLKAIAAVVDERCKIIDVRGAWMEGRETCVEGLGRFFEIDPDYRIHVESIGRNGDNALITGHVTARDPQFATTRLWRALTDDHYLQEWQSYSRELVPSISHLLIGEQAHKGPFLEGTR
jgi:ketosteroid isomerase-like protein